MSSPVQFAGPHRKKSRTGLIVFTILGVMMLACGAVTIGSLMAGGGDPATIHVPPTTYSPPQPKGSGQAGSKTIPVVPSPATIEAGTWAVGTDVKPGRYVTKGASDSQVPLCYWDVRAGSEAGQILTQGVKNTTTARGVVTLSKGQYFTTSGCKQWRMSK